ncbi:MAG TPA: nucleotidyltransferase family protein [Thermotogota bacterium]|nr:nucleotidyltransferase family protein [Thermotogota bacterium]HNR64554.1 nucleotidyltransferase family protein [Thermotogota bacterium]HNT96516.1 nucleotidyltransferase family protein [Thermotogota bacterium]HPH11514.1 nucleotidyltransferase family protein [Thermotogota bacterium]HPM21811.1 nucleotidyltransferase family protein [Thermotogota bacterium]
MKEDSIQKVLQELARRKQELNERFSVKKIGVFGSVARGEERSCSDVDIIVELGEPTFDNYMDLKFELEKIFRKPVDLVMADTVKPRLKPVIDKEAIYA